MAHPYTTIARLRLQAIRDRADALLDRDGDGVHDSGLVADVLERAANHIDAKLGRRYSVPFAAITDLSPTPGLVSDVCDRVAVALLYEPVDFDRHLALMQRADDLLREILNGEAYISATLRDADTAGARRAVKHESAGTVVAGRVDDDYTDTGSNKGRGI